MANGGGWGGGGKMFVRLHNLTNLLTNDCTLSLEENVCPMLNVPAQSELELSAQSNRLKSFM